MGTISEKSVASSKAETPNKRQNVLQNAMGLNLQSQFSSNLNAQLNNEKL